MKNFEKDRTYNMPDTKSLFPYYGYEDDGSPIEDGLEGGLDADQSMTSLWNSLHPSREIY